jgi:hypothetical protein
MDLYIVVSEVKFENSSSYYIQFVSQSLERTMNAYESIDKQEKDGVLLIKLKSEKMFDYEMFGISNYDDDIEIIKGYPSYNEVLKKR